MKILLSEYKPRKLIKSIAKQLGQDSATDCLEERIDLDTNTGNGKIASFDFSNGISLILFDCMLQEDWQINFSDAEIPLFFNFLIEGAMWHTYNNGDIRYQLNPLEGSITACPQGSAQKMRLPGKQKIRFTILLIDRKVYIDKIDCMLEDTPEKLTMLFEDVDAENPFFYQGNYSISASECIGKIIKDNHDGIIRSTYVEGISLELLSKQIRQYNDDLLYPEKQMVIRNYDLEKIKSARDILLSDLKNSPTISQLAKRSGINQQKLKKGFKAIFSSTINKYLTNVRLEQASLLLLKGCSVKEAALEVGYINHSHFSRKFKLKYGVLPKDYVAKINKDPLAAAVAKVEASSS